MIECDFIEESFPFYTNFESQRLVDIIIERKKVT